MCLHTLSLMNVALNDLKTVTTFSRLVFYHLNITGNGFI